MNLKIRDRVCEDGSCPKGDYPIDYTGSVCDRGGTEHRILRLVALEDLIERLEEVKRVSEEARRKEL